MKIIPRSVWSITLAALLACTATSRTVIGQGQKPEMLTGAQRLASGMSPVQQTDSLSAVRGLPSPSKATTLSALSTVIPITAGFAVWVTQEPERDPGGYSSGGRDPVLPLVLIGSGLMLGPSVGYFYGDCAGRGAKGIAFRGLTASVTTMAIVMILESDPDVSYDAFASASTVGIMGAAYIFSSSFRDLRNVERAVRTQNSKRLATTVGLAPGISPTSGTPVVMVQVRF